MSFLHSKTAEYTLFLSSHGTLTKIDHILGDNIHLNKFKRIEIIQRLLSDDNKINLEINKGKITQKFQNKRRLNNTLLNNTEVKEEI